MSRNLRSDMTFRIKVVANGYVVLRDNDYERGSQMNDDNTYVFGTEEEIVGFIEGALHSLLECPVESER